VIEFESNKSLPRRLLQILEHALIAGVVRNDKHELVRCLQYRSAFFHRQYSTIVGQRMNKNDGVLPRFDYFVEVANRAVLDSGRQGAVVPHSLIAFKQESS